MTGLKCGGERRNISSSVLYFLIGTCVVLVVLSACLITAIVFHHMHQKGWKMKSVLVKPVELIDMASLSPWERDIRLPSHIKPLHYQITLRPDLEAGLFSGSVDVDVNVTAPAPYVLIHNKGLNVTSTSLTRIDGKSHEVVKIKDTFLSQRNLFWVVKLPDETPLSIGTFRLSLAFNGSLTGKLVGFYKSTYKVSPTGPTRAIATSKFEPVDARAAFPCFDEPALKAKFTIKLVRPKNDYIALSNMDYDTPQEEDGPGPNEVTVHFKTSVPMSTYLVCFIVCDFKSSDKAIVNNHGVDLPVQVLATPKQVVNTDLALTFAQQVTQFYLEYFKISYPLPKLDLIAIPDFVSGAMEHWGLITFRETALLFDPKTNSESAKKRVASVVAHEIAHQWFGNLVTMAWWDDLWLNEGFASFMESKSLSQLADSKDWQMLEQVIYDDMQPVLQVDAALNSHPIVQSVANPDQINQLFDSVSYDKGQSVLRMLENFMGADKFQQGLINYLTKHSFGNAKTQDLWIFLDEAVGGQGLVPKVMATWTEQMGFPVVQVKRDADTITLTQQRFLTDASLSFDASESPYSYKWDIPVRYITSEQTEPQLIWFNRTLTSITLPINNLVTYVKFNPGQIGFYRVNYESLDWKVLTKNWKNLNRVDRAHLLDDVFSLASSNYTEYSNALDMIKSLATETEYLPWATGTTVLDTVSNLLSSTTTLPAFRKFIVSLVNGFYGTGPGQFSWTVPVDDTHLNRLHRVQILSAACGAQHATCLADVGDLFKLYLQNQNTAISPDVRSLVYYYGMKSVGTETAWNKLWEIYLKETNAQEKLNMMRALANAQEPWILTRYIEYAWSENNVRSQDYLTLLAYIAQTPIGAPIVWDFYRSQWPTLVERFGLQHRTLGSLILQVTATFSTQIRLDELNAFYAAYPEAGAGAASRKNAAEKIGTRIKWVSRNVAPIQEWLNKNVS